MEVRFKVSYYMSRECLREGWFDGGGGGGQGATWGTGIPGRGNSECQGLSWGLHMSPKQEGGQRGWSKVLKGETGIKVSGRQVMLGLSRHWRDLGLIPLGRWEL